MKPRTQSLTLMAVLVLAAALLSSGCRTISGAVPQKTRYLLSVRRSVRREPDPNGPVLEVRTLSVAAPFADRSFVYRVDDSTFESDYYNEFLAAPDRLITSEVREWMLASGLFRLVTDAYSGVESTYALEGHVADLYGDYRPGLDPKAVVEVQFMLIDTSGPHPSVVLFRRYRSEEPVAQHGPAGLVAAWNVAVARVLGQFEDAVRQIDLRRPAEQMGRPAHAPGAHPPASPARAPAQPG